MSDKDVFDTDILVVGAGPVGLALSLALGRDGNDVILIEQDGTRGPQPRAKTLNMRSLQHLRRWGLADEIRAVSPTPEGFPTDIVFQTRLYGHHIATLPSIYFRGNTHADDPRLCEPSEWVPQYMVEQVMKRRVEQLASVELRYATALVDFEQDDQGVTARLVSDGGAPRTVRAKYMVGADGGRSVVRDGIGARLEGRYAYDCNYNLVLAIPELNADPPEHRGIMHWLINEDSPGVMGPIGDLWYIGKKLPPGVSGMSEAEINAYLKGIVGRDVSFEIKALDPWYAHELIADRYQDRRIFIAGDACQLRPPFGGYGMNMGIGDAANLAWKLDAVLHGWGGAALLDSSEAERRQVHQWVVDEAVANYAVLSKELLRPSLEEDTPEGEAARAKLAIEAVAQKRREFHTIGLVLGYHYCGSPVVAPGPQLPTPAAEEYVPIAVPGALVPHLWLAPGVALYDRLGRGLSLLVRDADQASVAAISDAADQLGIPLQRVDLPGSASTLYPSRLTLVRPDEHVAWTADTANATSAMGALQLVTGRATPVGAGG